MLEILIGLSFVVVIMDWNLICYFLMMMLIFFVTQLNESGEIMVKLIFMMLSLWLTVMMMMSVNLSLKSNDLLVLLIFMLWSLIFVFFCDLLIWFYFAFEMSVVPIFLIIYGWGYQPDRLEAGFYMLCYTVFFSLPLLLKIFYLSHFNNSWSIFSFLMFLMAFLVKIPMIGLHFWLPRAHVEAPVFGSMILAGVMLKLGGYGMFKVTLILGDWLMKYSEFLLILSIMGGLFLSAVCFVQSDLKLLVAYSSIVHMSIVLAGLLSFHEYGLLGSIYMMVGHGFCSSGLFCILGLVYNRTHTRSILFNKGFISVIPISSLWWFLFCSSNLSFPPSLNLAGEIFLFLVILNYNFNLFIILFLLGFLSSLYSIFLFSFSQQSFSFMFFSFKSFTCYELLLLFLHWVPLNILIMDLSVFFY